MRPQAVEMRPTAHRRREQSRDGPASGIRRLEGCPKDAGSVAHLAHFAGTGRHLAGTWTQSRILRSKQGVGVELGSEGSARNTPETNLNATDTLTIDQVGSVPISCLEIFFSQRSSIAVDREGSLVLVTSIAVRWHRRISCCGDSAFPDVVDYLGLDAARMVFTKDTPSDRRQPTAQPARTMLHVLLDRPSSP